jgi:hypothetical protein
MKLSKVQLIALPVAGIAIAGISILGAGVANASSNAPAHLSRGARYETHYEARLARAVKNGKITSAQEQAILTEHNTLKHELTSTTKANRKAEWQTIKTQAKAWATQNNLNVRWLIRG